MSKPGYEKAASIGMDFASQALVIANARRTGFCNGAKIEGRRVDTSGDLAAALLLLDSVAYHIAAIYSRRLQDEQKGQPENRKKAAQNRDLIRNGICRWTSEMHTFFYPGHKHRFVSTANPWLVENAKTYRAMKILLPKAIAELASVSARYKGSWENVLITPVLDHLVWFANDLIQGMPGKPQGEEVFHEKAIGDFRAMHRDFVGEGVQANQPEWRPVSDLPPAVSNYLGTKLDTVKWRVEAAGGEIVVARGEIIRIGGRAYLVKKDSIKIIQGWQQSVDDLIML